MIDQITLDLEHEVWAIRNAYRSRRTSLPEAMDVFKEDLYTICIDKMRYGEHEEVFKKLLWDFKQLRVRGKLDVERARQAHCETVIRSFGFEPRRRMLNCPFHEDPNASLSIHPSGRFFKCFGCQEHGDAIAFVMKFCKYDFREAVNYVLRYA